MELKTHLLRHERRAVIRNEFGILKTIFLRKVTFVVLLAAFSALFFLSISQN